MNHCTVKHCSSPQLLLHPDPCICLGTPRVVFQSLLVRSVYSHCLSLPPSLPPFISPQPTTDTSSWPRPPYVSIWLFYVLLLISETDVRLLLVATPRLHAVSRQLPAVLPRWYGSAQKSLPQVRVSER